MIFSVLSLAGCSQSETKGGAPGAPGAGAAVEVGVVTLHAQPVMITVELPGRTKASATAEIRPQVAGIIKEVAFTEGGQVKAGDLLYRIDPASYEAAYQAALAALQKAQAAVPSAQAKVDRYSKLAGVNTITEQNLDDANATLLQAKADVASAQAAVDTAKINLDHTRVTAPISGLIGNSSITQGALVTANQTDALATIRQIDPMNVDLTDSSTNLLRIRNLFDSGRITRAGELPKVRLKLDDGSEYDQLGTLKSREAVVSETSGTFSMRVGIANPATMLLPGMYVRAVIDLGVDEKGFLVPQRAVSRNAKGQATAMFVGADGKVETRVLTALQSVGSSWLVDDGIVDGDRLIVDGLQKIRDGQAVTPLDVTLDAAGVVQQSDAGVAPAAAAPAKN
ncbi:efflux RND transporter periplasmic adaptor subunit [Kaistia dalseonensis]|uniref:Membrane fusion protein (Multidrug efflux system) n=1 Tax=Kaistia dalseonensis TaxID=410840 RepID=A0ABU0H6L0_9HYPH|nr:efflux RND transporter periplasmic adaptor subunit [Kaistia dalseonensis]MCX5495340.1 efflux RND transporter periplasmic adaptor subunit [Kaistia dalseonensis]MDQ0437926.1 membrane fusion protein (multidrug efflux system) [Kaistia dalseonensis]